MGVYFLFDIAFVFALQYRKFVYMMKSNNDYEKQCFVVYKNLLFLLVAFFTMWILRCGAVRSRLSRDRDREEDNLDRGRITVFLIPMLHNKPGGCHTDLRTLQRL